MHANINSSLVALIEAVVMLIKMSLSRPLWSLFRITHTEARLRVLRSPSRTSKVVWFSLRMAPVCKMKMSELLSL